MVYLLLSFIRDNPVPALLRRFLVTTTSTKKFVVVFMERLAMVSQHKLCTTTNSGFFKDAAGKEELS